MAVRCLRCHAEIEKTYKACPHCGEPLTDFLRRYADEPVDGKYQILERLGAGGMGEVYKVQHTFLGATRVIKVIRPQISESKDAHERFLREARAATKIHHPNMATLHDFSALPDGSHYMVWEYIDGENIAQRLRSRGTMQPRYAVRVIIEALRGLEALHRAGIVHRDISPENIMITRESHGEEGVKIIDLGVAKVEEPGDNATRAGVFVGKLRYASPEHLGFLNEGEKIDGRADLYSLAMVLYEMLTGRPPFEATSPHEYLLLHSRATEFRPLDLPADLPGGSELQQVLKRALERDRNLRYASAREFAAALERVEQSLPDPRLMKTMNIETFDADETWRPTPPPVADTLHRSTVRSAVQSQAAAPAAAETPTVRTPLPSAIPPAAAATIRTPLPQPISPAPAAVTEHAQVVSKTRHGGAKAFLVIALILVVAAAAIAFVMMRGRSEERLPPVQPPIVVAQRNPAPAPQATVEVHSPAPIATATGAPPTTSTISGAVPPSPITSPEYTAPITTTTAAPTTTRRERGQSPVTTTFVQSTTTRSTAPTTTREPRSTTPPQPADPPPPTPPPPPAPNVRTFLDGDLGDSDINDQLMTALSRQVQGTRSVVIRGSGDMHAELVRRFKNEFPSIAVVESADVVIDFEGNLERLSRGKKRRSAKATISKGGRVIFRYELPDEEYRVGDTPAEAFHRVLTDAFGQ